MGPLIQDPANALRDELQWDDLIYNPANQALSKWIEHLIV